MKEGHFDSSGANSRPLDRLESIPTIGSK